MGVPRFIKTYVKNKIIENVKYAILEKSALIAKLLVILSAVFTLVGVIGFKVTAGSAKGEVEALVAINDMLALAGILDKVILFSSFIRVGAFLMLLFAISVLVINCIAGFELVGSVGGGIITVVGFILSFQLLVYRSLSAIMEAGASNLISLSGVQGMIPVNFILGLTIVELIFAFFGLLTNGI